MNIDNIQMWPDKGRINCHNLTPEAVCEQIVKYIDTVKTFNGVIVLLWHNSSIYPGGRGSEFKEVYERVMKYMKNKNAWLTSNKQIIDW